MKSQKKWLKLKKSASEIRYKYNKLYLCSQICSQ